MLFTEQETEAQGREVPSPRAKPWRAAGSPQTPPLRPKIKQWLCPRQTASCSLRPPQGTRGHLSSSSPQTRTHQAWGPRPPGTRAVSQQSPARTRRTGRSMWAERGPDLREMIRTLQAHAGPAGTEAEGIQQQTPEQGCGQPPTGHAGFLRPSQVASAWKHRAGILPHSPTSPRRK